MKLCYYIGKEAEIVQLWLLYPKMLRQRFACLWETNALTALLFCVPSMFVPESSLSIFMARGHTLSVMSNNLIEQSPEAATNWFSWTSLQAVWYIPSCVSNLLVSRQAREKALRIKRCDSGGGQLENKDFAIPYQTVVLWRCYWDERVIVRTKWQRICMVG